MKLPANGSLLANLLIFGGGALLGAAGYWTIDMAKPRLSETAASERQEDHWEAVRSTGSAAFPVRVDGAASAGLDRGAGGDDVARQALLAEDPRARAEMLRRAGADGARGDLEAALRIGHGLKRLQDRLDYFRGLFAVWSETDPEAAIAYAKQTFSPGLEQAELISLVVNKWGSNNPHDARVWTEQNLSGPLREQALTDLMVGWTRRNPELASKWVQESGLGSQPLMAAVGTTWAERDPQAAAAWALSLPGGAGRRAATLAVANEFAREDPEAAAVAFEDALAEESPDALDLATVIADVWATVDPASTASWIGTLPDGSVRDQAAGALATVWAAHDIDAAVEWSRTIGDLSMRQQVIAHLGTTWGALEPDKAIAWLATIDRAEAEAGLIGAFNSWGAVDPAGMADWVESAQASDLSDQARRSLADVLSQRDVYGALDMAMGIADQAERDEAVARYFRLWRKTDDASAQEWLGEVWSGLPVDLKARLGKEQKVRVVSR